MKKEAKQSNEAQLLDLLKRVLPKATHDAQQTLDLMIHFLEIGTAAIESFGMDYAEFFDSMESMFRRVFTRLTGKDNKLLPIFMTRLQALERASRDTGYGYGDSLADMMAELEGPLRRRSSTDGVPKHRDI